MCIRDRHIGVELLLGEAAQCAGELGHQLGHIVHGLDGAFQRVIDHFQAFLQLQDVYKRQVPPLPRTSSIMFSASTMGTSNSISCMVR